jgi:hypothetical protein
MSYAVTVHLSNEATLRDLESTAEALEISIDELAEAAFRIAVLSNNVKGRLEGLSERLHAYGPADLEQDIQEFARSEVTFRDPLQARRVDIQDPYGIGALFDRSMERG